MSNNGMVKKTSIDPLAPQAGVTIISIIQYVNNKGQTVQDVQSHLMKDLRNEQFVFHMIDTARKQLIDWYKMQKDLRRIGGSEMEKR